MAAFISRGINFMKQSTRDYPEIVLSNIHAIIGIAIASHAVYQYDKKELWKRRYVKHFRVVRPDDPRAEAVRFL